MHFLITFACGLGVVGSFLLLFTGGLMLWEYFDDLPGDIQDALATVFLGIPLALGLICGVGALVVHSFHIPI